MAGSIGVGILIAVAAVAAGMGGVTLSGTGGSRHLRGVAVARSRNALGVAIATLGAGVGANTGGGTAGSGGHLGGVAVAGSTGVVILVAVRTSGAGISGIALRRTSGSSHHAGIVVTQLGNGFRLGVITDGTGISLHTGGGTGSRRGDGAAVPAVNAAVTADRTHAIGIVAVRHDGRVSILIAVRTSGAGMSGVALSSTGRSCHLAGVAVAQLGNGFGVAVLTGRAGILSGAGGGTGSRRGHRAGVTVRASGTAVAALAGAAVPAVAGSRDGLSLGSTTNRTGVGLHTGGGTASSRGHRAAVVAVTRGRGFITVIAVATGAGINRVTLRRTSGRNNRARSVLVGMGIGNDQHIAVIIKGEVVGTAGCDQLTVVVTFHKLPANIGGRGGGIPNFTVITQPGFTLDHLELIGAGSQRHTICIAAACPGHSRSGPAVEVTGKADRQHITTVAALAAGVAVTGGCDGFGVTAGTVGTLVRSNTVGGTGGCRRHR